MAKQKTLSETHRRYGELLTHFASAKTSDEAGLRFIEDMKNAFGFPVKVKSSIVHRYLPDEDNIFPTINAFKLSLSRQEDTLLSLVMREKENLSLISEIFNIGEFRFKEYDAVEKTLRFDHYTIHGGGVDEDGEPWADVECDGYEDYTIEDVKKHIDRLTSYQGEVARQDLFAAVDELMEVGKAINALRMAIDEQSYAKIRGSLIYYENLLKEHGHIDKLRNMTRAALEYIVRKKARDESFDNIFNKLIETYNVMNKNPLYIYSYNQGNLELRSDPPFDPEFFLNRSESMWISEDENLKGYYDDPLAYCLVEFLKEKNARNYLKKCHYCEKYHIRKNIAKHDHYFCSKKCNDAFKNAKRTPEEKQEAVKQSRLTKRAEKMRSEFERIIKHMVTQGWKEREAKEDIKGDIVKYIKYLQKNKWKENAELFFRAVM